MMKVYGRQQRLNNRSISMAGAAVACLLYCVFSSNLSFGMVNDRVSDQRVAGASLQSKSSRILNASQLSLTSHENIDQGDHKHNAAKATSRRSLKKRASNRSFLFNGHSFITKNTGSGDATSQWMLSRSKAQHAGGDMSQLLKTVVLKN